MWNHCYVVVCLFFNKTLEIGLYSLDGIWVKLNKGKPKEWAFFRELIWGSNSYNSLKMEHFEELWTYTTSSSHCYTTDFQSLLGFMTEGFQVYPELEKRELEKYRLKCHKTHHSSPNSFIFLRKYSSDYSNPFVNYQFKKSRYWPFWQCSHFFYGSVDFWISYCVIS